MLHLESALARPGTQHPNPPLLTTFSRSIVFINIAGCTFISGEEQET